MFATVIVAHLLAVLFTFCGVVQLCVQLGGPRPESAGEFVGSLLLSCWPLAVAVLIELLVQIACMLEKMLLQKADPAEKAVAERKMPFKPVTKKQSEPASASGQFFRANPVPPTPPAPTTPVVSKPEPPVEPVKKEEVKETPAAEKPQKKESSLSYFRVD